MTESDVLEKAADLIERDGWCQGGDGRDGKCRCMMVAIADASDSAPPPRLSLWQRTRDAIWGYLGVTSGAKWNDAPERTAAEVIAALRSAAAKLRTTETP